MSSALTFHWDPFLGEVDLCRRPEKCPVAAGSHWQTLEAAHAAVTAATADASVLKAGGFAALPQEAKRLLVDDAHLQQLREGVAVANRALADEGWRGEFKLTEEAAQAVVPFQGRFYSVPVRRVCLEGGPEGLGEATVVGALSSTASGLLLQVRPGVRFTSESLPTAECRGCRRSQEKLLMVAHREELLGGYCEQCLPEGLGVTPAAATAGAAPELSALVRACSGLQGFSPELLCKEKRRVWPTALVLSLVRALYEKEGFIQASAGKSSTKVKTLCLLEQEAPEQRDPWGKELWSLAARRGGEVLRRLALEGLKQEPRYNQDWSFNVAAVLKQDFVARTDIGFLASCLVPALDAEKKKGLKRAFVGKVGKTWPELTVEVISAEPQEVTGGETWLQVAALEKHYGFRVFWSSRHGEVALTAGEELHLEGVTVVAKEQSMLVASARLSVEAWEQVATGASYSERLEG